MCDRESFAKIIDAIWELQKADIEPLSDGSEDAKLAEESE